ncbi:Peroxidase [Melia azedarach]|uniref:Peroxidase n=1 Tax=Melia azedarach TaxID=155640 RepID=A0ACC1XM07_MELAZ|nr:Peroxidase [Melia azedarach]
MAFRLPALFFLFVSLPIFSHSAPLTLDYYKATCPDFERIVREHVHEKQLKHPSTAAATLRLFFHDCFVEGCDASLLITSNAFNHAERDSDPNISLPGDAFEIITRIKTALELACPGVVSCADILSAATLNLVVMLGGPRYELLLGRKDGLVSQSAKVAENLPRTNMTMDELIKVFEKKGMTTQEMVALIGAHTIGFSNCKEFADRIYRFSPTQPTDPEINPKYADALKTLCTNHHINKTMSAFNDVLTPGKFDNMFYKNLPRGLGLLPSDHMLYKDPRTKPFVDTYAANESAFFKDFSAAMMKLGQVGVKTEPHEGDVRRRCDTFNAVNA